MPSALTKLSNESVATRSEPSSTLESLHGALSLGRRAWQPGAVRRLWIALVWLSILACESRTPLRRSAPVGVLEGHVRLAAGAALPAYAPFDLARRVLREHRARTPPAECAAANEAARRAVALGGDRGLEGVVVAASDFTRFREREPNLHRVTIRGCRLRPSTVTATLGDFIEIENADPFPFAPLLGPQYKAQDLATGERVRLPVKAGEADSVVCNRDAPCGRTDVLTFYHPVHTVSGSDGAFRIAEFPAGQLVRVSAWHPLFQDAETFVWIEPGGQGQAEFLLSPRERFVDQNK